ncbi:MAG: acetolactate synthase small subunit [Oscillospiraceae bacterium]
MEFMPLRMEKEYLLSVTAKNHTGVLLRIAGLFSRRCYNISSIVAAQSEDSETSRLIIVVKGDDKIVRQVEKQLCKLCDVEQVMVLNSEEAVVREYLLIRVMHSEETNAQLVAIANVFHADMLHVSEKAMVLELAGSAATLNSFVEILKPYGIEKILRTGAMAMTIEERNEEKSC